MLATIRRVRFDWQIFPLLLAAGWGLIAAFNTRLAALQFGFVLLGIGLYFLLANLPDPILVGGHSRSVLAGFLIGLPLVLSLGFLLTSDWSRWIGKLRVLDPVLEMLAASPLNSGRLDWNPNSIGSAIAILLPLQLFALRQARRWMAVVAVAVSLVALLISQARGAWLALALTAFASAWWVVISARVANRRRRYAIWSLLAILGCAACVAAITRTPVGGWLLDRSGDRVNIWRNSLSLVRDYPLTGMGLGSYEMAYASYALLTHVGSIDHAHNLLLDVWLSLGALGLIALLGMIANAMWPKPSSPWRTAALASSSVMLMHGLVDDTLWGSVFLIPVMFVPLALLTRSAESTSVAPRRGFQPAAAIWLASAVGLLAALITPAGQAALEANWGALRQTRAELSVYHWPDIPLQDVLRRSGQGETALVVDLYQRAITRDPGNATAQWRLGQIELAQGHYDEACQHLGAAYVAAPEHRAVRQLLGECYALADRADRAVELWRTIDTTESQLTLRRWWYETYLGDTTRTSRLNRAVAMLSAEQAALPNEH